MGTVTESSRSSSFLPAFDTGLQIIMVTLSTAGLNWLAVWPANGDRRDGQAVVTTAEIEQYVQAASDKAAQRRQQCNQRAVDAAELERRLKEAEACRARLQNVRAEHDRVNKELEAVAHQLDRLRESLRDVERKQSQLEREGHALQAEREKLDQQRRQLEEQLRELAKKQRDLREEKAKIEQLRKELEELERQAREAAEANKQKREDIAREESRRRAKPTLLRVETPPRAHAEADRKPVFIMLVDGTVTPVREPYYRFVDLPDGSKGVILAQRGEDAGRALSAGSVFLELLNKIDAKKEKEYVFLLVDRSSFETFRAVRAEVRAWGIKNGWVPVSGPNIRYASSGGTDPWTQD